MPLPPTYLIFLPERQQQADFELCYHNIPYIPFKAIHDSQNPARGLRLTMQCLFDEAITQGHKDILVFEDDVQLTKDFETSCIKCIEQLPNDYLLFYAGLNLRHYPRKYSKNLLTLKNGYATHAVMYSYEAMKIILQLLNIPDSDVQNLPYDVLLQQHLQVSTEKCFCAFPLLAGQRSGFSYIQGKEVHYNFGFRFAKMTMHLRKINR